MLESLKSFVVSKVVSLYLKTNGWKTIIGFLVAKATAAILVYFPDAPARELTVVLEYFGNALLVIGIAHIGLKNLFTPDAPRIVSAAKKLVLFLSLLLYGLPAWAQDTPTPTSTATFTPPSVRTGTARGGIDTTQVFFMPRAIAILPTQVPTAFSTPQVVNTQPLRQIEISNGLNCALGINYVGGDDTQEYVQAAERLSLNFGADGFHHSGNIKIRKQGACTTGMLYISAKY